MNAPLRHLTDPAGLYAIIRAVAAEATPTPGGESYRSHSQDALREALRLSLRVAIEAADAADATDIASLLRDLVRGEGLALQLAAYNSEATKDHLDDTANELAEDLARVVAGWGADDFAHAPLPHQMLARGLAKMRDSDLPLLAVALRQVKRDPAMRAACKMIGGAA